MGHTASATITTTYSYDPLDRLTNVHIASGTSFQARGFSYDGDGSLRTADGPESGHTDYSQHDARGHLVSSTDASCITTKRTYDCAERLVEEDSGALANPVFRKLRYDGSYPGRLVTRVIDLEVSHEGRVLGGVEAKTGNSRYLPPQRAKDVYLGMRGYPVNSVHRPPNW